uniref:Intraflagellar transport protein 46 homolog n=1 Tax=Moina brachiata TaxID=675436 RepID=A0A4Y7NL36_9CRUS|nr:EOG090X0FP3 [Moina brachiata]
MEVEVDAENPVAKRNESQWSEGEDELPDGKDQSPSRGQLSDNLLRNEDETEQDGNTKDETLTDDPMQDEEADLTDEELYNPGEFNSINVPPEVKEILQFITKYRPPILEIETKLKPFIPDFIPAVGDPDAFLKVDRPDGKPETLGLTVIDEPSLHQSDPSVLDLRLRSIYKQSSAKAIIAKSVDESNKGKAIEKWIKDIGDLHRSKPLPTVTYAKPLPDIDTLLQEWSPDVEDVLREEGVPPAELDCDLSTYVDIACEINFYRCEVEMPTGEHPMSRQELLERIEGKHGLFCLLTDKIDAELLDRAGPQLKVIGTMSVGYDHVDMKEVMNRGVLDQDALVNALKTGQIGAAGLDVMTPEPLPPDHELTKLKNCVLPEGYEVLDTYYDGNGVRRHVRRLSDGGVFDWLEINYKQLDDALKEVLISEINTVKKVSHPNVVRHEEAIVKKDISTVFLITEPAQQQTLQTLIDSQRK